MLDKVSDPTVPTVSASSQVLAAVADLTSTSDGASASPTKAGNLAARFTHTWYAAHTPALGWAGNGYVVCGAVAPTLDAAPAPFRTTATVVVFLVEVAMRTAASIS